ncbi:hypothetical protein D3C77_565330 [compost metagenome]
MQSLLGIFLYIPAVYQYLSLCRIIKTWYKVNQRTLSASCCPNKRNGLALARGKANMMKDAVAGIRILKAYISEFNLSLDSRYALGCRSIYYFRFGIKHLIDPSCRYGCTGQHNEDHAEHHKGHNNLHSVGGEDHHIRE